MMAIRIHRIISMQPKMTLVYVLIITIFAVIQPAVGDAEWMNDCGVCHCKWISSKKQADCKNTSLISVPREMSVELQVIDLSFNIIPELRGNEFKDANLPNLHKIYMKNCTLQEIHRDAFKGLHLLIELDLSNNFLKVLYPGTFTDVIRLRVLIVTHNQLEYLDDNLFENLGFLAKVDFRYNELKSISQHTFVNVSAIREIDLENNQLTVLKEESFRGMDNLRSLTLNQNPWNCTCDLQAFQKFAITRGLYTPPTDCHLPMNLRGKLWTDVPAENFACRPVILYPHDGFTIDANTENITISCRLKGSPKPHIDWLYNNRPMNLEDQRISIRDTQDENRRDSIDYYVSELHIVGVKTEDRGTYTCLAKNTGGVSKVDTHVAVTSVLESVDGMGMGIIGSTAGVPTNNSPNLLFIVCLVAIVLLTLLIIVVLILCCYCRRVKTYSKNGSISENGLVASKIDRSTDGSMLEGSVIMEMQKSLLTEVNPVEKPPRRSETDGKSIPSDDVQEIKKTLLDEQSYGHHEDETHSIALSDTTPRSRATFVDDGYGTNLPPDLLSFPSRYPPSSSTQSSITNIPEGNLYIKSPIASPIYQHNAYAAQQAGYRTLQHPKNRNLAIINPRTSSPFQPAPILYAPIMMKQQGYVTIPRKPRTPSWAPSITSTLVDFPPTSPTSTISTELAIDPIYDNLGLRTSASGHSALSVKKQQQLLLQQQHNQPMAVSVSGSLDHIGAGPSYTMKDRPLPATPRIYEPIQEQQQIFPNGGELCGMNDETELLFNKSIEPHPIIVSANAINNNLISNINTSNLSNSNNNNPNTNGISDKSAAAQSAAAAAAVAASNKVPPRPPPKPKKKMTTISAITENPELAADGTHLFQDECEDGTEV